MKSLPDASVNCCVTSPPYWGLRDYGHADQIGLERTPEEYVGVMVQVFREVRRVLRKDGTLWLNLGDSYASNPTKGGSGPNGKHGYGEGYARALRRGSGRADGIVTNESPRNRDGAPPCDLAAKNLIGIPWRVALALQADGWYLRSDIIWHKPNPMPESVTDRPTKSHEYVFLMAKSESYFYDHEAIKEPLAESTMNDGRNSTGRHTQGENGSKYHRDESPDNAGEDKPSWYRAKTFVNPESGRNKRSVWTVPTMSYKDAHFATFPPDLIKPCILAGCPAGGLVLDPFAGSGTTGKVALELGRRAVLIELNPTYLKLSDQRCCTTLGLPLAV
jgi:DNA modification methylase